MPPIFATPGTMIPRQFGPMIRAPRMSASSTIWATSPRGIRSVTIDDQPDAVLDRLEDRVLGERGGTVTTEPYGTAPVASTTCATVS